MVWRRWAALGLIGLLVAVAPIRMVRSGAEGKQLIAVLGATGRTQLAVGVLVAVGLALSS